jgi:hypothetical protein
VFQILTNPVFITNVFKYKIHTRWKCLFHVFTISFSCLGILSGKLTTCSNVPFSFIIPTEHVKDLSSWDEYSNL